MNENLKRGYIFLWSPKRIGYLISNRNVGADVLLWHRGLLVLFMTREITDGGMNLSAPEAMAIYGIYGASVYFLCVPGGWVADKIFGAQRTVLYGAIVITLGHYVLAHLIKHFLRFGFSFDRYRIIETKHLNNSW